MRALQWHQRHGGSHPADRLNSQGRDTARLLRQSGLGLLSNDLDVWVGPAHDVSAPSTATASCRLVIRIRIDTAECLGKRLTEGRLSDAAWAMEEVGVIDFLVTDCASQTLNRGAVDPVRPGALL